MISVMAALFVAGNAFITWRLLSQERRFFAGEKEDLYV